MFLSPLTTGQLNAIRTNGYSASQYVLFAPNTVVFRARVNQASFTPSFALVNYDSVAIGSHTAIKEGFTVYIGATTDIRTASFIGYARRDNAGVVATATSININQTSADIQDNWWITVVKDVRLWYKLPRIVDVNNIFKDYSLTYRRLRPLVTGLQSCYVRVLASGNADFALAPSASAVDADATSSFTWAWDADGGTFQAGSASTKDVTLRYTTAGHYMPRVTVTDSNGVTNWFTCHVFVVPSNYSSVVETGAEDATIERNLETGNNATLAFFEGVDTLPDYTFCAIWSPNNLSTKYSTEIQFVGRLRNEQIDSVLDPISAYTPRTSFDVEGIGAELGRLFNAASLTMRNVASPTKWDEIEKLTPLRALAYYLSEHTSLTNIASLLLDDLTNTFNTQAITLDKSSALEQCQRLLDTTNRMFEYAPSGGIRTRRKAWYLLDTDRNALDTITQILLRDMQVDASGGAIYSVSGDMVNTVGKFRAAGASYNEATNKMQVYEALAPAVSPTEGDDNGLLNGQILTANVLGYDELGSRCANAFAEAQPPVLMTAELLDAYEGLIPGVGQWYTFDLPAETNNRGIAYSSAERWTLQSVTIQYRNFDGRRLVTGVFRLETKGEGFQVIVVIPPEATQQPAPIVPLTSPYPNLQTDPTIRTPNPDNIPLDDAPPFTPEDVAQVTQPIQPGTIVEQAQQSGVAGMAWTGDTVYAVSNIANSPIFANVTPINLDGMTVRDGKLSKFDNKGYVLASDGALSRFFRTNAFGAVDYARTEIVGNYRLIRTTNSATALYCYGGKSTAVISVAANVAGNGVASGITVNAGDLMEFVAPGTWNAGGPVVSANGNGNPASADARMPGSINGIAFSLVGRIGTSGNWFFIGSANSIIANATGQLYMGMNDNNFGDNSGALNVQVTTINASGDITTKYSTNNGTAFGYAILVGAPTSSDAGVDTDIIGTRIYAAADAKVRQANSGGAYSDATGGSTTGTYPMCIVAFGTTTDKYIMATPASVSGESVWKVVGGTPTAITPNDGVSDGLAVSPNCIAMADGIETHIVAVLSFGGVRKLAYSVDGGSNWGFNTQITNSASYVRMIRVGTLYYIGVCDGGTLWWGTWDGTGAITLFERTAPQSLAGFEFR